MSHRNSYYIVNGITLYRLIAAPLLILLIVKGEQELFKWLLPFSFFTDMLDGYLARKYQTISKFGALIDSIADDLTVAAGVIGVFVVAPDFVRQQQAWIIVMFIMYLSETFYSLYKYKKMSGFHTYIAKAGALIQGTYLILFFWIQNMPLLFFYIAAGITIMDLLEEILLVYLLDSWHTNVKGIYWVLKAKNRNRAK
ncbi:MAG: CDP-alcohol phosphatidyltransferase family protein [Bacteroidetes bacterium]|nr:CDP-alcohol phosphatidyltransferase family protein [Bacteroidota bacterium]